MGGGCGRCFNGVVFVGLVMYVVFDSLWSSKSGVLVFAGACATQHILWWWLYCILALP